METFERISFRVSLIVGEEEMKNLAENEIRAIGNDIVYWEGLSNTEVFASLAKLKAVSACIYKLKEMISITDNPYIFVSHHFQIRGVQRFEKADMDMLVYAIRRAYRFLYRSGNFDFGQKIRFNDKESGFTLAVSKQGKNGMDLVTCFKAEKASGVSLQRKSPAKKRKNRKEKVA